MFSTPKLYLNFFIFLAIVSILFYFQKIYADPIFRINNGGNLQINKFSVCKDVTNSSGKDIMVPTNSSGEWSDFLAHLPAGVTATTCVLTPTFVNGRAIMYGSTISKPTGLQVGDLMIAHLFNDTGGLTGVTAPSGFAVLDSPATFCGGYEVGTWQKVADATDVAGSGFTFTKSGGWGTNGIMMMAIRNVNQTTPIQANNRNSGTGTTVTYSAETTTQSNSMILVMAELCSGDQPSAPSGFTLNYNYAAADTSFSSKIQASAGSTGVITSTIPNSAAWGSTLVVINPP
jgi:hypothetical protein